MMRAIFESIEKREDEPIQCELEFASSMAGPAISWVCIAALTPVLVLTMVRTGWLPRIAEGEERHPHRFLTRCGCYRRTKTAAFWLACSAI